MSMMLTGRKYKNCLPKNANGWSHRCRSISVRSIPCLLMNGRKSVNATRNIMAAISVTMPSGFWGLLHDRYLYGCNRNRYNCSTKLWQMKKQLTLGTSSLNSVGCFCIFPEIMFKTNYDLQFRQLRN